MGTFSISEAALSGFTLARRKPKVIVFWFLFTVAMFIVFSVIIGVFMGAAVMRMASNPAGMSDPAAAAQVAAGMTGGIIIAYLLMIPIGLLFQSMYVTAANRAMLQPTPDSWGYLRLGADELRTLAVMFVLFLLFLAAYAVCVLIIAVTVGAAAAARASGAMAGIGILMGLAVAAGMVFFGIRLSLASPLTFDSKRINIFGSWSLTKGHFWRIFATYLLALLIAIGVMFAFYLVMTILVLIFAGGMAASASNLESNPGAIAGMLGVMIPLGLAYLVLVGLMGSLTSAIMLCPAGAIYRGLTQKSEADVF
ncbi:hypothetical protein BH11PSE2_BH11PSE2_08920 [soil metagenome]